MLLVLLVACNHFPDEVTASGRVFDGADDSSSGLGGAVVSTYDVNGKGVDEVSADSDGRFEAQVAANQAFYLVGSADGFLPTSFTGLAGSDDFELDDHTFWARSSDAAAAIRAEFAGCPSDDPGLVEGIVRLYLPVQESTEELPIVTTATVTVEDESGDNHDGCYLDDDGASDPAATVTGQTGRFAVTGVPEGPVTVVVDYTISGETASSTWAIGYMPEGGTIPMYPAWAQTP